MQNPTPKYDSLNQTSVMFQPTTTAAVKAVAIVIFKCLHAYLRVDHVPEFIFQLPELCTTANAWMVS